MKRIIFLICMILTIHQNYGQTGNDIYYYAEGQRHYFSTDSTSVNIIVSNMQHYDTIASALCTFYSDSTKYTVFYSNDDDNIVVSSKSTPLRNVDSLLHQIDPNNNDIAFISYSKQMGTSHFWLRNELYVKFKDSLQALSELALILPQYTINQIVYEGENEYRLVVNDESQLLQLSNVLYDTTKVIYSTPDFYGEIVLNTSDEHFGEQWGLLNTGQDGGQEGYDIRAELAWDFLNDYFGNSLYPTIRVAVIDDGVENHEDLYDQNGQSKVVQGCTPSWTDHGAPVSKSKHGECCAGIIAATHNNIGIAGVAENTQIIPIRIFKNKEDNHGGLKPFSFARIAKGIKKAWKDLGADILSNSWSEEDVIISNDKLNHSIAQALSDGRNHKGCIVVFSSGNNNKSQVNYPANQSGVIAVGGIERCGWRAGDHLNVNMCNFWATSSGKVGSCYGSALSVVAPGTNIWTTDRQGSGYGYDVIGKYIYKNGTSLACPHVSGVVALMLSVNPSLTQSQIHSIINRTANRSLPYEFVHTNGHSDGTWNEEVGYGLVDAHKAVCEARLFGYNFSIQGETVLNTCSNYTYSLIGNLPPEFDVVWEVNSQMVIVEGQGTSQIVVKSLCPATGNWVIAHICHAGEIIRTIENLGYIVSVGPSVSMITFSDITLTSNTTWDYKGQLAFSVTIDSLATLTITDTLLCTSTARIIVRPGGKLIVNGGTITNACDGEMWQGIIVEGNANIRQAALAQGSVILNNATIENARDAICTMGSNPDSVFEHTGGIVQATNTLFRNNRRSVEFLSYENHTTGGAVTDNASYFTRCTFTVDNNNYFANNNITFENHVTMWHVRGVKFNGCAFRNETSSHDGKAIYTIGAGFTARRVCPMPTLEPCVCNNYGTDTVRRCLFVGFDTAVHATNTEGSYLVTLDNCDFADNYIGVELAAADNARVSFCDFDMVHTVNGNVGLDMKNSTGYTVEGNSFHRTNTSTLTSIGICVDNSGTAENVMRLNEFTKIKYGCYAWNCNAETRTRPSPGLQYTCNDYDSCRYGIFVGNAANIRSIQGSASVGADNSFYNNIGSGKSISIPANHSNVKYYYYDSGSHVPVGSSNYTPLQSTNANSCASTLCGGGIVNPKGALALSQYQAMAEEYATIVETLRGVETCHGASLQTDAPDQQDETDDADVIVRLSDLSAAMGDLARSEIRTLLNDSVPDMALLKRWYATIMETQNFASPQMADSIIPVAAYQLAETYSMEGDLAAAATLLASLPQQFTPDEASRKEYANYMALQQLRETVAGNWYAMTDTDIAAMQQVAEYDNGRAARMAKEILCFFHHICYEDELLWDWDGIGERALRGDGACPTATTDDGLHLHPNPTTHTLTVESASTIRTLTVYDLAGRVMITMDGGDTISVMDVSSLPNGIYLLRAVTDNGVETGRFVKN